MPIFLLVIAGIVLLVATPYATLGWILLFVGLGASIIMLALFGTFAAFTLRRF